MKSIVTVALFLALVMLKPVQLWLQNTGHGRYQAITLDALSIYRPTPMAQVIAASIWLARSAKLSGQSRRESYRMSAP